ncbi:MAG: SDR family NAD(P)-dependent oxidoreductase [Eubacteriales bacterium]|nr:SDR family NAD(P)-dependent oxidoreductase [Eubacteriales bacterium]
MKKRIAIITGASSGLGAECARQIDGDCDEIYLLARRKERLDELAQSLDTPAKTIAIDLSYKAERETILQEILREIDRGAELSHLILAAGFGRVGYLGDEAEAAEAMIELNITALTHFTATLIPHCRGICLLFASVAAFTPQPNFAVYAASKAYVLSLSRALKMEYPDAHVLAVCPNPVETEFFNHTKGGESAIKKIGIEKKEHVVASALRKAKRGRSISLSCFWSKSIHVASKIFPTQWILTVSHWLGIY